MFIRILTLFSLLLSFGLAQQQDILLRVLLAEGSNANLAIGSHQLVNGAGTQEAPAGTLRLALSGGQVLVDGQPEGSWVEFAANDGFTFGGKPYRGNLLAVAQSGRLLFINRIWLEEYLLGVVPSEVPASFPDSVLEAQAILARTFALFRLNPKGLYDICASERCQVYRGRSAETVRHTSAVYATQGLIVSYNQHPITAVYHADSGGYTASSSEVWGASEPYLVSRPDPYSTSPGGTWKRTLSPAEVSSALARQGLSVGSVQSVQTLTYTESGRPSKLRVAGSSRSLILDTVQASKFLRSMGFPSTRVQISGWQVVGYGNGHGVGMSQWGARGLAAIGWDFRQILGYYYPGTFLSNFEVVAGLRDQLYASGYRGLVAQR